MDETFKLQGPVKPLELTCLPQFSAKTAKRDVTREMAVCLGCRQTASKLLLHFRAMDISLEP